MKLNVGQCIYCGEKSRPLTREHVLPRGLGGNEAPAELKNALVLQNASCTRCQSITQDIERRCLQQALDTGRARLGLKRKDRSNQTGRARVVELDGTETERDLPVDQIHGAIVIPAFHTAGAFDGRDIGVPAPCDFKMIVVEPASPALMASVRSVGTPMVLDSKVFAQMLAKIALGLAVAHYGVDGFRPLVRDMIVRRPEEYGHWVGGFPDENEIVDDTTSFHRLHMGVQPLHSGSFIVVSLKLFAQYGGPSNYVVVGQPL